MKPASNRRRGVPRSSTNHWPTVWCGVLADCRTVGGMDAAIEPHGRVHGVSGERRGHRALDAATLLQVVVLASQL
ncbi:hypothetical protein CAB38_20255 [Xanthomonas citri pv. punicae]|nr:hypothetical protein CAI14_06735 [Xanthomonas citri pv. punicae]QCZ68088.1 hypothetical protein CAI17_04380 [Xanthomonas citri pv. punicae]QCZ74654.1 hypothetical protein CAB38_20255 [Xanthomonas citri pv. punicae]